MTLGPSVLHLRHQQMHAHPHRRAPTLKPAGDGCRESRTAVTLGTPADCRSRGATAPSVTAALAWCPVANRGWAPGAEAFSTSARSESEQSSRGQHNTASCWQAGEAQCCVPAPRVTPSVPRVPFACCRTARSCGRSYARAPGGSTGILVLMALHSARDVSAVLCLDSV